MHIHRHRFPYLRASVLGVVSMVQWRLAINGVGTGWSVACCATFWSRLRGQLAAPRQCEHAWMLRPCSAVHIMFLATAIDVAFCNAEGEVIRLIARMQPWHCAAHRGAVSAWEFPAGALGQLTLARGDRLSLWSWQ